jgi:hypothetical protein
MRVFQLPSLNFSIGDEVMHARGRASIFICDKMVFDLYSSLSSNLREQGDGVMNAREREPASLFVQCGYFNFHPSTSQLEMK